MEDSLEITDVENLDLIFSICNESSDFMNKLPESPPDSEHFLSPGNSYQQLSPDISGNTFVMMSPSSSDVVVVSPSEFPDLSKVDFNPALRFIENQCKEQENPPKRQKRNSSSCQKSNIKMEPCESDGYFNSGNTIGFHSHGPKKWNGLASADLIEISLSPLAVSADKGFNFSLADEAFIVQKKNHFQISVVIHLPKIQKDIHYVNTIDEGLKEIESLQLNLYGVKYENTESRIEIEQSLPNRSKIKLEPIPVLLKGKETLVSVGRLHFSETTSYNMRKKGKPNPAQKYFRLMVALEAVVMENERKRSEYPVAMSISDRIIVRASNPGQFESESESLWNKNESDGQTVYRMGNVGINTEHSKEALTLIGNIQLTGSILVPSDIRLKDKIREIDSEKQLQNVNNIKIVSYKYKDEFLRPNEMSVEQTGVIAQNIQDVLPDAVISSGNYRLQNGKEIENMLIVNKDRLFLENIGAVRQLSKLTVNIEKRIFDLEAASEQNSVSQNQETSLSIPHPEKRIKKNLFNYTLIQGLILCLFLIMAVSLVSIATIYVLDYYYSKDSPLPTNVSNFESENSFSFQTKSTMIFSLLSTSSPFKISKKKGSQDDEENDVKSVFILGDEEEICDEHKNCKKYCCSNVNSLKTHLDNSSLSKVSNGNFLFGSSDKNSDDKIIDKLFQKNKDINDIVPSGNETIGKKHEDENKLRGANDGHFRTIRSAEFQDLTFQDNKNSFSTLSLVTKSRNYSIDVSLYHRRDSSDNIFDIHISISQHFSEPFIKIVFPSSEFPVIQCPIYQGDQFCEDVIDRNHFKEVSNSIQTIFHVNVSRYKISRFRFRSGSSPMDLCDSLKDKHLFQEYNLIFLRRCVV